MSSLPTKISGHKKEIINSPVVSRSKTRPLIYILCGLALIAIIPLYLYIVTVLHRIPADFSYDAELFSLDNIYDEQSNQYTGEKQSIAYFTYRTLARYGTILELENQLDVRTAQGEPIVSITRLFGVDSRTGKHIPGYGDKKRSGYMISPNNVSNKQSFIYWHVNYDVPATMNFDGEEVLGGLTVYRYVADFAGQRIDQTDNLHHLPDVPTTRGVLVEPTLTVWLEPLSGYLVRYEDESIAYYYDQGTKEKIAPWNSFSNTYSQDALQKHIAIAKEKYSSMIFLRQYIPHSMSIIAVIFIMWGLWTLKKPMTAYQRYYPILASIMLVALYLVMRMITDHTTTKHIDTHKTILIPSLSDINVSDETMVGFFAALESAGYQEGTNLNYIYVDGDGDSEVLQERLEETLSIHRDDIDLIYLVSTPLAILVSEIEHTIPVVFGAVAYPVESGIIDSLQSSGNNFVGSRVHVAPEIQLQNFLQLVPTAKRILFVHKQGEPNSQYQYREFQTISDRFGVEIVSLTATDAVDLDQKLASISMGEFDALYAPCDSLTQSAGVDIYFKHKERLQIPDFNCLARGVEAGSLMGTVPDLVEVSQLAGESAVLILNGATPSSLETNTVARSLIYINKHEIDSLGSTVPQTLLLKGSVIVE